MPDIVVVSQDDPVPDTNACGSKVYVTNLLHYLAEEKQDPLFIGVSPRDYRAFDLPYRFMGMKLFRNTTIHFLMALLIRVKQRQITPSSLIHAQKPLELIPFLIRFPENPKILTLHGQELGRIRFKKSRLAVYIYEKLETWILKNIDAVIAVDEVTSSYYIKEYPFLKDRIHIIPTGVDVPKLKKVSSNNKFPTMASKKRIIFVGRLEPEKNLELLLDAFQIARGNSDGLELVIAGDGSRKTVLQDYVRDQKISGVTFLGSVNNDEIPSLLNSASAFILTSHYEGSPIVVKEALAVNLPVVSVDVGDVKTLIGELPGCYITRKDKYDISDKILEVLQDPREYDYSDFIMDFNYDRIGAMTLALYRKIARAG
ncbi:MAG: glycosyltransferase family 4 protein [Candidatus Cloacimonetes bacterium]|nr:glycosyltransferase family 4 protein [Candidatus Cloacimonadota bacterium]